MQGGKVKRSMEGKADARGHYKIHDEYIMQGKADVRVRHLEDITM